MPERPLPLPWRQAAILLEARLRELTGQAPERLDRVTVERCYPRRSYVSAWRVGVAFSDGVIRRVDVVATASFPVIPVRTALVDHPPFMTWPHVESDGILCLLPNMAECDPDDSCEVATDLLGRSVRLINELLEGAIVERDFREEFLTYWAYKAHADGSHFFSLLAPEPPSRIVRIWRGKGIEVAGEDVGAVTQWGRRRYGEDIDTKCEAAAFVWLRVPPLPAEYPETASDLRTLTLMAGDDAAAVLDEAAAGGPDHLVAIFGATGRGGAGLVAVKAPNPKLLSLHPRAAAEPLSKGYQPGRTPKPVLLNRYFGSGPVIRSSVQRADATWIHGRARDPRTARLLACTVVLFGCGSVGAPIACALAQAGVGRIVLVDHDVLSWPNVGRHPLGASSVGRNKAESLAERLQTDFPHLQIESRNCGLHDIVRNDPDLLHGASLIVATTGSWSAENGLNRWHVGQGRSRPILYGWTEAHACAGHAVAIAGDGGCFQCHICRTGAPSFRVVEWLEGGDANQEEPACGAHYQPYGPVELGYVTAMISDLALDCLLDPPQQSLHRIFAASPRRIVGLGGRWSDQWLAEHGESGGGVRSVDRSWPRLACLACQTEP
jgi:hypothetical protein